MKEAHPHLKNGTNPSIILVSSATAYTTFPVSYYHGGITIIMLCKSLQNDQGVLFVVGRQLAFNTIASINVGILFSGI